MTMNCLAKPTQRTARTRSTRASQCCRATGHFIDTTTPAGKLVFGIFVALAEFESDLISERTKAGLASARVRGRKGGAPFKMTAAKKKSVDFFLYNNIL